MTQYSIFDTVIMGNQHLYEIMKEKDALYEKDDFTEEDGMRASRARGRVCRAGRLGGRIRRIAKLLQGLGIRRGAAL